MLKGKALELNLAQQGLVGARFALAHCTAKRKADCERVVLDYQKLIIRLAREVLEECRNV